jgi:hypothetical protein
LVDVDLEQRVVALVEARRPQLVELVRQVVDRELEQLVAAELERRGDGNGHEAPASDSTPSTKMCTSCARTLPLSKFEAHRWKCRECRRRERETRAQEPDPELPRTD